MSGPVYSRTSDAVLLKQYMSCVKRGMYREEMMEIMERRFTQSGQKPDLSGDGFIMSVKYNRLMERLYPLLPCEIVLPKSPVNYTTEEMCEAILSM